MGKASIKSYLQLCRFWLLEARGAHSVKSARNALEIWPLDTWRNLRVYVYCTFNLRLVSRGKSCYESRVAKVVSEAIHIRAKSPVNEVFSTFSSFDFRKKMWYCTTFLVPFVQFKKREKHPWRSCRELRETRC